MRKQKALMLGVFLLIVLWLLMLFFKQTYIEQDVNNNALSVLSEAGHSQVDIFNSGHGRDLILSGIVRTQGELDSIIDIASKAYGVHKVDSSGLELKQYELASFNLDFSQDKISISGVMQSESIASAISEASRASGDGYFTNNLSVNADVETTEWVGKLPGLIKSLTSFEKGKLEIADNNATISGLVRAQSDFDQISTAVSQSLGDMDIDLSGLEVRPFQRSTLELYQSGQGVVVSGKIGSEQAHAQLIDVVNKTFSNADISELEFNDDIEPISWVADAIDLIDFLPGLESPRLLINSEGVELSGIARTKEIGAEIESMLSSMENLWPVNSTVEFKPWQEPNLNVYFSKNAFSISGLLPPGESTQQILDALGEVSTSIDDESLELHEDTWKPEWLESALLGISGFQFLKEGSLSIENSAVSIKGVAETDREYESLIALLEKTDAGRALIETLGSNIDVILTDEMVCASQFNESFTSNTIEFETKSAIITENRFDFLDTLIEILGSCPKAAMEVAGHTDNLGNGNYNIDLSERRASSGVKYMQNSGVSPDRMTTKGYGSSQPIADNNSSAGRALNRRIEINIIMTR